MDVPHPLEIGLSVIFRREFDLALFYCFYCAIGQRLNLDEPLRGKPWLYDGLTTVALADSQRMVLDAGKQAKSFHVTQDLFPRFVAVQTGVRPAVLVDARLVVHYVDLLEIVAQANGEIVGIMRWRNFYCTAA